ncbi:MAG TPA: sulfatase-like hydrolase/transferase, partial [Acidobacteriota bacterium]
MRSVLICLFLAFLPFAGCSKKVQEQTAKPNVLLITLDTTRADRLGCYGYKTAQTPNLDALARSGVRFTNAITHVPLTRPSHASILTGMLPYHHGVWDNGSYRLKTESQTIAESFKESGYNTGAIISTHILIRSF